MTKGKHAASVAQRRIRELESEVQALGERLVEARAWKPDADRVPGLVAQIGELQRQIDAGASDRELALRERLCAERSDLERQLRTLSTAYLQNMEKVNPAEGRPGRHRARHADRGTVTATLGDESPLAIATEWADIRAAYPTETEVTPCPG